METLAPAQIDSHQANFQLTPLDELSIRTAASFAFMELQDVQELTNFFERRVSAYQVGVQGEVAFDQAF
jgi:hypothetical protein